ncbi:MAG TPA: lipid II flippase MurJ, partial [Wenzhouxiangella sp.]
YGAFGLSDVQMAAWALMAYCIGLPAFIGVKGLAPAFFSRQDAKTPVRVAVGALLTHMVLNVVFVLAMVAWWSGFDFSHGLMKTLASYPGLHVGLATASSVTAWLNAGLLWHHLKAVDLAPRIAPKRAMAVGVAGLVMAMGLWLVVPGTQDWVAWTLFRRVYQLLAFVGLGAVLFAATLWVFGVRPDDFQRPSDEQTR